MKTPSIIRFLVVAAFAFLGATSLQAQATRTWVSGVGDDANPCSRTAPCKTFAGAISKTADKGEISVLDPGGFGAVTITKSITLNGTGTLAGILSAGTNGVNVNDINAAAGPNTSIVILRDISINGAGSGVNGINYVSGKSVTVDHCWIYGVTTHGINVNKTAAGRLIVNDTKIENVTQDGIHMTTTSGKIAATIERTRITNCSGDGIEAATNVAAIITNSNITTDLGAGVKSSGASNVVDVDHTAIAFCSFGLQSSASSFLQASDCIIAQNITGLSQNGGIIDSFQGNSLVANTTDGAFSTTTNKK